MEELSLGELSKMLDKAFSRGKDKNADKHYLKMLETALERAYGQKIEKMEELVDALNNHEEYTLILLTVNSIDRDCRGIFRKLKAQREKMGLPMEDDDE